MCDNPMYDRSHGLRMAMLIFQIGSKTGADPGFEKGGGLLAPKIFWANVKDFLKDLAQKGVGMHPPSVSAPAKACMISVTFEI